MQHRWSTRWWRSSTRRGSIPGEMSKDAFITKVLEAVDNPQIIAALAAHGQPVAG
jgi:hypothetical protein